VNEKQDRYGRTPLQRAGIRFRAEMWCVLRWYQQGIGPHVRIDGTYRYPTRAERHAERRHMDHQRMALQAAYLGQRE